MKPLTVVEGELCAGESALPVAAGQGAGSVSL